MKHPSPPTSLIAPIDHASRSLRKKTYRAVLKTLALGSVWAISPLALADTLTWDADLLTAGAQDGNGTWTPTTTNFWATTTAANQTPINGTDSLVIGSATGGSTITIDAGGTLLNFSTTPTSSLTFAQSYTLSGLTSDDGIAAADIFVNAGVTATISATLSTLGAAKTWNVGAGSILNISGGGQLQNITGAPSTGVGATVNISGGNWTTNGTVNLGGGAGILTVNQTGGSVITSTAGFKFGSNSASTVGTTMTYLMNGGTIVPGGAVSIGAGTNGFAGNTTFTAQSGTLNALGQEIRVGNDGGSGILNAGGATVSTTGKIVISRRANASAAVISAVNISGGIVTASQAVQLGDNQNFAAGSSATLSITGGTLYTASINVGGTNANLATAINLGGGTIGGVGGFSSSMAMNLTGVNGNIKFKAADVNDIPLAMTLSGSLSGVGGLTKTGGGQLNLSSVSNTYSGSTLVSAGTLVASSLGTGNVEIADGASLTLNLFTAIGSSAILTLDGGTSLVNLNFTGTAQVAGLVVNDVTFGPGTYDTSTLGSQFSGTGMITVVPEPSSLAFLILGMGALCLGIRRNQPRQALARIEQ
jgi:hypothetical protein